jgi:hypothetical protein
VPLSPVPLVDAVIAWVATESDGYRPGSGGGGMTLRLRAPDALLVALTLTPALALLGA